MKIDPGMHIGLHLVSFGKSGVTLYLMEQLYEYKMVENCSVVE
jgi:hypothetical protein